MLTYWLCNLRLRTLGFGVMQNFACLVCVDIWVSCLRVGCLLTVGFLR